MGYLILIECLIAIALYAGAHGLVKYVRTSTGLLAAFAAAFFARAIAFAVIPATVAGWLLFSL